MGAWIETANVAIYAFIFVVAPRVGAWIETNVVRRLSVSSLSPPAWGRGLKLSCSTLLLLLIVAPRVGAWIETVADYIKAQIDESPPAWGRGLKQ